MAGYLMEGNENVVSHEGSSFRFAWGGVGQTAKRREGTSVIAFLDGVEPGRA